MANNPPPSSTGLILTVNSAIEKATAAIASLSDLEARARAVSSNPSAHYIEQHYNRAPSLSDTRQKTNAPKRYQKQKSPYFIY